MGDYTHPVNQLLSIGDLWEARPAERDYRADFGLSEEHIPELVRLATDRGLWENYRVPESNGTLFAMHALACLGARDRLPELLDFICEMDRIDWTGDWLSECLPKFYAQFGHVILPLLKTELDRTDRTESMRLAALSAMAELAGRDPEQRMDVIHQTIAILENGDNEPDFNGLLIGQLIDLDAVEAADAIERAYQRRAVGTWICGDLAYVRYHLGLGPKPERPSASEFFSPVHDSEFTRQTHFSGGATAKAKAEKRKAKRKAEKQARKINRR